jgi:MFS family permease
MFGLARDALATRDLRRLQFASLAAGIGGWAFMIALAVHAYAVGGAPAVGLAAFVRMAPAGLAAPLTGLAADRFPRRDVLLAAVLIRALLLGAAALAVALGGPFWLLLVLATLFTVAATAHKPAQAALLPQLAPSLARQAASNALWTAIDNGAFVAGAIAGGVLVAELGAGAAFAGAGAAFVAAAFGLARIEREPTETRVHGRRAAGATGEPRAWAAAPAGEARGWTGGALDGLRVVARDPRLRLLVGVLSVSTFVEGMVDVLVVVVALKLVGLGEAGVGWLNAAWGIGGLLGGAVALKLLARAQLSLALPSGGILIGAPLVALALVPGPAAAVAALTLLGVGYALTESAGITLMQRLAHDRVRARAFGVVESAYWLTTGAGAMLAPAVVALAGPRGALVLVGAALPVLVLTRLNALRRLATGATAGRPAAASASARPGRAGARSPVAAPGARPVSPVARRS